MRATATAGFYGLLLTITALVIATRVVPVLAGTAPVVLTGQSMSPGMPMGSLVYIDPKADQNVGDIVTFTHGGQLWTHRIVSETHALSSYDEKRWQTKGDAMSEPDPFVIDPKTIHGVAIWHVPYVGYAVLFAQQPASWVFLSLLALFLLWASGQPRYLLNKVRAEHPARAYLANLK